MRSMKLFLRAVLFFIYFCLLLCLNPNEAFAINNCATELSSNNCILENKTEISFKHKPEDYCIVTQNPTKIEVSNTLNKNDNSNPVFNDNIFDNDNFFKFILFNKNTNNNNRIVHKISPNLKNAIYTRAP